MKISWKTLLIALLCLRKTQNNILQMLKKSKGHQLQLLGQTSLSNSEGRLDFFKCTLLKWKKVNRTGSRNKNSSWGWQGWQLQATKLSHPSPGFVKFPTGSSGGVHRVHVTNGAFIVSQFKILHRPTTLWQKSNIISCLWRFSTHKWTTTPPRLVLQSLLSHRVSCNGSTRHPSLEKSPSAWSPWQWSQPTSNSNEDTILVWWAA